MRVTEGLDSTDRARRESRSRLTTTTPRSPKLGELGGELVVRALDDLDAGRLTFTDQTNRWRPTREDLNRGAPA
jgi:hypothetical protein